MRAAFKFNISLKFNSMQLNSATPNPMSIVKVINLVGIHIAHMRVAIIINNLIAT